MANAYALLDNISTFGSAWRVLVKVDSVFPRTDFDFSLTSCGYPKRVICLEIIVFDEKGSRMIMRLRGDSVIDRFANVLCEGKVFYVEHFMVGTGGDGVHPKYHIMFMPFTVVREHVTIAPDHGFLLMDAQQLKDDASHEHRVRDVMGLFCRVERFGWEVFKGCINWVFEFIIADRHLQTITVRLNGESAMHAWKDFRRVINMEKLCLVVQYGVVKKDRGNVLLMNYGCATRVFWNPKFKEVMQIRRCLFAKLRDRAA